MSVRNKMVTYNLTQDITQQEKIVKNLLNQGVVLTKFLFDNHHIYF